MPDEENATYAVWSGEIETRLAGLKGPVALVGHSVGGSVLLKYVCERQPGQRIAGLFVVAAPFWGASEDWRWDEGALPADAASKLAGDWPLVFYHNRDDEVVPFEHLAEYAAKLPRATIRALEEGGHQFGNDLAVVAADIRRSQK
jgi:predicted alpha/beta hydrolase family esterase